LAALTTRRAPFTQALQVYQHLMGAGGAGEAGVILEYGDTAAREPEAPHAPAAPRLSLVQPPAPALRLAGAVSRVDVIGAGNFARTMLLPHLKGRVPLGTVVNNTALSSNHARTKFGFAHAATDHRSLLADEANAALLIATRHNLHAPLVTAALAANRHVFVEKPLCLTTGELRDIESALGSSRGTVQVGFNRRFAGAATQLQALLRDTPGPKTASYRVMAGSLEPASWYANYAESGG